MIAEIEKTIKSAFDELHRSANRISEEGYILIDNIESIVELSKEVYNEGDDYYGYDYLSQRLTIEEKAVLKEIMEDNLLPDSLFVEMKKLNKRLDKFYQDLQEEIKEINSLNHNK